MTILASPIAQAIESNVPATIMPEVMGRLFSIATVIMDGLKFWIVLSKVCLLTMNMENLILRIV